MVRLLPGRGRRRFPLEAWLIAISLAMSLACACSSSGSTDAGEADAGGTADAGVCDSTPGMCCPLPCARGNSLHVGAYCTLNGGQCAQYGDGLLACSLDLSPSQGGNFCVRIGCASDSSCGAEACCYQQQACVPLGCGCPPIPDGGAPALDAGMDAGVDSGVDAG
jgi:hypothetical protein